MTPTTTRYQWQSTSGTTALTTTTATQIAPAVSTTDYNGNTIGSRNYVTDLVVSNTSTTVSTTVSILDGSTVIWTAYAPNVPSGTQVAPLIINLTTPMRGSAGNALSIKLGTTSANVYWSAQGFYANT